MNRLAVVIPGLMLLAGVQPSYADMKEVSLSLVSKACAEETDCVTADNGGVLQVTSKKGGWIANCGGSGPGSKDTCTVTSLISVNPRQSAGQGAASVAASIAPILENTGHPDGSTQGLSVGNSRSRGKQSQ